MKWSKEKTKQEIEDELFRELETYTHKDLIEFLLARLNLEERKEWVDQWHKED